MYHSNDMTAITEEISIEVSFLTLNLHNHHCTSIEKEKKINNICQFIELLKLSDIRNFNQYIITDFSKWILILGIKTTLTI